MPRQVLAPATALAIPRRPRDRPAPTAAEHALTRREVEEVLRTSRQAFDRLRHREDFPRPRRWLRGSPRWLAGEVQDWLQGPSARTPQLWSWPFAAHTRSGAVIVPLYVELPAELHQWLRARVGVRPRAVHAFVADALRRHLARLEPAAKKRSEDE